MVRRLAANLPLPLLAAALLLIANGALPSSGHAEATPVVGPGTTLLGFYSWNPLAFADLAGRPHAVRWRTVDWDPSNNFGETWAATLAAAADGGWALQVTWNSERYDTTVGGPVEVISPGAIARGQGDAQIVEAAAALRAATVPVVLRFDAEMNGYWHSYCAVNRDGSARDADHSAAAFIAAWRRVRTIFRGGTPSGVDGALAALGQPPLTVSVADPVGAPDVAFAWVPNVSANPAVDGNTHLAQEYYPGDAYVDWVGVDIYDSLPDNTDWAFNRSLLDEHYAAHPAKPFGFFEWGLLSGTDDAQFVSDAFDWIDEHPRVELLDWYDNAHSQLALNPAAAAVYRTRIQSPRYVSSWPTATTAPNPTGPSPSPPQPSSPPQPPSPSPPQPPAAGPSSMAQQPGGSTNQGVGGATTASIETAPPTAAARPRPARARSRIAIRNALRAGPKPTLFLRIACIGPAGGAPCTGRLTVARIRLRRSSGRWVESGRTTTGAYWLRAGPQRAVGVRLPPPAIEKGTCASFRVLATEASVGGAGVTHARVRVCRPH